MYDVLVAAGPRRHRAAIILGPWVYRLTTDLAAERAERVRTQERADLAAHLHDSVLQTLALIQKNAGDAPTVARLARSQERDLRSWLFDAAPVGDGTLAGALREVVREIEDTYGVDVELVTVGDVDLDDSLAPDRRRGPGGDDQRRQARRHPGGRPLRRGGRDARSRCSSATAAPASTPRPSPPTGRASATASSTGWHATAAPPRSGPRPAPAPRCG